MAKKAAPRKRSGKQPVRQDQKTVTIELTPQEINLLGQVLIQIPWKAGQSQAMKLAESILGKLGAIRPPSSSKDSSKDAK